MSAQARVLVCTPAPALRRWLLLFIGTLVTAFCVHGAAWADHIRGSFVDEEGNALIVEQHGLVVTGIAIEEHGKQHRLNGRSDGQDYASGTVTEVDTNETWGSFELFFEPGNEPIVRLYVYEGSFGREVSSHVMFPGRPGPAAQRPNAQPRGPKQRDANDPAPPPRRDVPQQQTRGPRLPYDNGPAKGPGQGQPPPNHKSNKLPY